MLFSSFKFSICVVGWHFQHKFYSYFSNNERVFVVAHRKNPLLQNTEHVVIDNIGLEFGAYDWYLKNKWDGTSKVLLTHDDTYLNGVVVDEIIKKTNLIDIAYLRGTMRDSRFGALGGRCIVVSRNAIEFILNRGGIWFDEGNTGQTDGWSAGGTRYDVARKRFNKQGRNFSEEGGSVGIVSIDGLRLGRRGVVLPKKKVLSKKKKKVLISYRKFLEIKIPHVHPHVMLVTDGGKRRKIREIIDWLSDERIMGELKSKSAPHNWKFLNCILYGFRKGVKAWDKKKLFKGNPTGEYSSEYYLSLEKMTSEEIKCFLKKNIIIKRNKTVVDGNHRLFAMIGRILNNQSYLPFYTVN